MGYVIIGVLLYLALSWVISDEFGDIAQRKGHSKKRYFWFCFFFGIAGYLMVVALPDEHAALRRMADDSALQDPPK